MQGYSQCILQLPLQVDWAELYHLTAFVRCEIWMKKKKRKEKKKVFLFLDNAYKQMETGRKSWK